MKSLFVTCPACREVLEIDAARGTVIKHYPEVKAKPGSDFLAERMKGLEEEKVKREAVVAGHKEREKGRLSRHEELFKKVKEEAQEGPPADRPLREVDLD